MTDERPRPQYGEYAPPGWVSPVPVEVPEAVAAPSAPAAAAVPARPTWDVALTVGLLALGLYSVVSGFVAFADAPALFRQVFDTLGIGDFTSNEAANSAGPVIMAVQAVIWIAAAALAVRALRRGTLAFIWPVAGGVLANVIVGIIVGVVIAGDPAYLEYLGVTAP